MEIIAPLCFGSFIWAADFLLHSSAEIGNFSFCAQLGIIAPLLAIMMIVSLHTGNCCKNATFKPVVSTDALKVAIIVVIQAHSVLSTTNTTQLAVLAVVESFEPIILTVLWQLMIEHSFLQEKILFSLWTSSAQNGMMFRLSTFCAKVFSPCFRTSLFAQVVWAVSGLPVKCPGSSDCLTSFLGHIITVPDPGKFRINSIEIVVISHQLWQLLCKAIKNSWMATKNWLESKPVGPWNQHEQLYYWFSGWISKDLLFFFFFYCWKFLVSLILLFLKGTTISQWRRKNGFFPWVLESRFFFSSFYVIWWLVPSPQNQGKK
jgi:hypothetical protein